MRRYGSILVWAGSSAWLRESRKRTPVRTSALHAETKVWPHGREFKSLPAHHKCSRPKLSHIQADVSPLFEFQTTHRYYLVLDVCLDSSWLVFQEPSSCQ